MDGGLYLQRATAWRLIEPLDPSAMKTHYDNLKVARNAPPEVIKAAYKALCQKYHPDKYAGGAEAADRIMKIINAAYAVLSDPIKRKEYDQTLDDMDALDEEEGSEESSQQHTAPEDEAKPKAPQDGYASESKAESTPDESIPILRPALTGALWFFILGFSNAHKLPAGNYGWEFFYVALASGILGATMGFFIVIVVQWVRRLSGAIPSTPSRINILLDTFSPIKSISEAEANLKAACFGIIGLGIFLIVVKLSVGSMLGAIDGALMSLLAWWCYQNKSTLAAYILVALCLVGAASTGINRFSGTDGGQNLFMAIALFLASVIAFRSMSFINKNEGSGNQPSPQAAGEHSWMDRTIAILVALAILVWGFVALDIAKQEGKPQVFNPKASGFDPSTAVLLEDKPQTANEAGLKGDAADKEGRYAEAIRWYRLAADQGDARAQFNLGVAYNTGRGVTQNYAEAVKWFRLAAERGDGDAQNHLGHVYRYGQGVDQNYAEAVRWFRLAADQGSADAQLNLGSAYFTGLGIAQNYTEAVHWFQMAANQGNAGGQVNLGAMYAKGQGVPQNDAEAVRLYKLAVDQGSAQGRVNLGIHYALGLGLAKNDIEACRLFKLAADQGNINGQYLLGDMFKNGRGVHQSYAEAARWFRLAADQGDARAQQELDKLRY